MSNVRPFILQDHHIVELCYYGTRVFSSKSDFEKLNSNNSLGRLILFLGLCLVIITGVDLSNLSYTVTQTEQSIWPSSGRGIWIGLFVMTVGVFTIIAVKEQTHSAFYILLPYTLVAIVLSFFGLLTSIAVLQRYTIDPSLSQPVNRDKQQGIQFALAGLLIGIFALTFLFLSCLSCMICWTIPNFCTKFEGQNPRPIPSSRSVFSQDFPLASPRTPHRQRFISNSPRQPYRRPRVPNRVIRTQ